MQRQLDKFEEMYAQSGMNYPAISKYIGSLRDDALSDVFKLIQQKYPILRTTITTHDNGKMLNLSNVSPGYYHLDGGVTDLHSELIKPIDYTQSTCRLIHVRNTEGRGFVALQISHALADLNCCRAILGELWRIYANLVEGSIDEVQPTATLPASPLGALRDEGLDTSSLEKDAAFLSDRDRHFLGKKNMNRPSLRENESFPDRSRTSLELALTEHETRTIVDLARMNHVRTHDLLAGIVAFSQRQMIDRLRPTPIVLSTVVDLRKHSFPYVAPTDVTNFLVLRSMEIHIAPSHDPIAVAHTISRKMEFSLSSARHVTFPPVLPIPATYSFPDIENALCRPYSSIYFNNAGVLAEYSASVDLSLSTFPENKPRPGRLKNRVSPKSTAVESNVAPLPGVVCSANCSNSRLSLRLGWDSSAETGRKSPAELGGYIIDEFARLLETCEK